jgi:hypothetical protein
MRTSRTTVAVLSLVCLFLADCGKISDESYAKVKDGMSLSQVQSILGEGDKEESTGTSISTSGLAGSSSSALLSRRQTYSWKDGDKQVVIEFADDKLVSKRKIGF